MSSETIADVSSDYVEPLSKSTTASNHLSSDDDAIEIETSEIVPKILNLTTGHLILQSIKSRTASYFTTSVNMVTIVSFADCSKKIPKMSQNATYFFPFQARSLFSQ